MSRRCFLKYPCGKLWQLSIPIYIIGSDGNRLAILPGSDRYFECAKKKFEINDLKVIEKDVAEQQYTTNEEFVSLSHKTRCIE